MTSRGHACKGRSLFPGLVPGYLVHFPESVFAQLLIHGRICDYGMYGIGHRIDVPIVCLYHIVEDLGTSALLRYYRRDAHLHGLQR